METCISSYVSTEVKMEKLHVPNACVLPILDTSIVTVWQVDGEIQRWDQSTSLQGADSIGGPREEMLLY